MDPQERVVVLPLPVACRGAADRKGRLLVNYLT